MTQFVSRLLRAQFLSQRIISLKSAIYNSRGESLFSKCKIMYFCRNFQVQRSFQSVQEFTESLESIPYIQLMDESLDMVRKDLMSDENAAISDVLKWNEEVFNYNVIHGKKIRAVAFLKAYAAYSHKKGNQAWKDLQSPEWRSAVVIAWCIEMLQAFFIVADDIMDQSKMRRGTPCWYQLPNVGLCAINDSLLLQNGIFKLLRKHLGNEACYLNILHEFLQVTQNTVYGQCIDMLSNPPNQKPRLEDFTFKRYQTLVEYKTSHYTFCLPIHLAMHLVGGYSDADFKISKDLCLKLGLYFQSWDDFLDCFGDPKVTGKYSNDINEGKCTWFAVKFLETAPPHLLEEFKANFAINDANAIAKVLELYNLASLREKFKEFDTALSSEILHSIKPLSETEAGLYFHLYNQLRNRSK